MHAKTVFIAASAFALAACATLNDGTPVARATCKVAPITTASATGAHPRAPSSIEQRYAEMQLATSDYRMNRLQQPLGAVGNSVEDALHDCPGDEPAASAPEQPAAAPR